MSSPSRRKRQRCASISTKPKRMHERCLVPGFHRPGCACSHALMDRQTDRLLDFLAVGLLTEGPIQSPSAEQHGEKKPLCERERKRKGKGKRLSLLWTKQKPQMIRNVPQHPTYRQGYGKSRSKACCEATKAASSGRCKRPGAHSVIVVSSWDKTTASSLLPEPTTGSRSTSPEVCPSLAASSHRQRGQGR